MCPENVVFWNLVEEIGWKKGVNDNYKSIRTHLTFKYKKNQNIPKEMLSVLEIYHREMLESIYEAWLKCSPSVLFGMGGQRGDDLISEIIGRGREYYNEVLRDPMIAAKMYKENDYAESFRYCFPNERDFFDIGMGENLVYPSSVTIILKSKNLKEDEEK